MKTTNTKLKAQFRDLSNGQPEDNERVMNIYSHKKHIMTVRVVDGFVDIENELTGETYNVLEILESGVIVNDTPKKE